MTHKLLTRVDQFGSSEVVVVAGGIGLELLRVGAITGRPSRRRSGRSPIRSGPPSPTTRDR